MNRTGNSKLSAGTSRQLEVKCPNCNEPIRQESDDSFRLLDGTLVHTRCRTTQEFFEAVFGCALDDLSLEQEAQERDAALLVKRLSRADERKKP